MQLRSCSGHNLWSQSDSACMSFIYRFFIKRLSFSSKFYIFQLQLIPEPVELSFTCYSDLIALVWGYPAWSLHEDAMFSWTLSRHMSSTALQFKKLIPFSNELTTATTTHYVVNFCYGGVRAQTHQNFHMYLPPWFHDREMILFTHLRSFSMHFSFLIKPKTVTIFTVRKHVFGFCLTCPKAWAYS